MTRGVERNDPEQGWAAHQRGAAERDLIEQVLLHCGEPRVQASRWPGITRE
jgi:hypothetical protein